MSDVNTFIETIGKDVDAAVAPKVQALSETVSATVRDFATAVIEDLFHRYRPELRGEIHATMVQGAIELTGQGVTLDLKRRDTGASVSSLDIPISLRVKVNDLSVRVQNTTIRLDVIK